MFPDYLIPRWLTYVIYIFLLVTPAMISTYLHTSACLAGR